MPDTSKSVMETVSVELSVVLGHTYMPVHQLLRMGRGAVIELDGTDADEVQIFANSKQIARGEVVIKSDRIAIEVTHMVKRGELVGESV